MVGKFSEIKKRYKNVMCSVENEQMVQDMQDLISYVDALHSVLVHQAQMKAAEEALRVFESGGAGMRVPC